MNEDKNCPYFPCSEFGTNCKHCYCPFYPCRNSKTGGKYVVVPDNFEIWDCTDCKIIHNDEYVKIINLDKNEKRKYMLKWGWMRVRGILNNKNVE